MKQSEGNAWDGFDKGEYIYEERSEKKYQSTIWKVLAGVFALSLLVLAVSHVKEISLVLNGNSIEATYYVDPSGRVKANYYDEERNLHAYDFTGIYAAHDKDSITLYYRDDIRRAVPRTPFRYWTIRYLFFIVLLAFSVWRIYKIYNKPLY